MDLLIRLNDEVESYLRFVKENDHLDECMVLH